MNGKVVIAIVVLGLFVGGVAAYILYSLFESMFGLGWVGLGLSLAIFAFIFGGIFRALMTAKR
jgi:hypothetical protein